MKIEIVPLKKFRKELSKLIRRNKLLEKDYEEFKQEIAKYPDQGDIIPGVAGVRKIRLKSARGGKSGGFRICYFYYIKDGKIFLILIYPKNVQENLTYEQIKFLKVIVNEIEKS